MSQPPRDGELLATMFMFSLLITSGLFYTLGARFHWVIAWPVIPGIALAATAFMYWRVRVRRGAAPTNPPPPQNPSTEHQHPDR